VIQNEPGQAGSSFTGSVWVKTSGLAGGAEAWLAWYSAANASLRWDKLGAVAATANWTWISGTRTAPSGTATARLVLRTVKETDGAGTAWFDDASLTVGSSSSSTTTAAAVEPGGTGLKADYFDNVDFTALRATRTDPAVDFDWAGGAPVPGMGADTFSVRWTGYVEAPAGGTYTFATVSDDGVRLWVNGQPLVNHWIPHAATEDSGMLVLSAGQRAAVRMEFFENGGLAVARLLWSGPGIARQVVPSNRLFPQ
jgi:hypothetical protein